MDRHILIVEDDNLVRESLYDTLSARGYQVIAAASAEEGLERIAQAAFDVVLVDLRLPNMTGMDFLRTARSEYPAVEFIMMTSFATVETAVEAMKIGAAEYITKPINDDELEIILKKIFKVHDLEQENTSLKNALSIRRSRFHNLIGEDAKMQKIYSVVEAIADTETTVLIRGESGTGKGMVAQAIHYSDPARCNGPYIEVSCGAIPKDLLESELFGHVKGAFTNAIRDRIGRFELANNGTILLDECILPHSFIAFLL
ncbi:sigma 54-interacting transcriptional regulator [Omnitrophica bacterium]|nr:sigma 54-interacting transcriptional regulator [Candidatus Omnitrophota bacterium]